MSVKYPEFSGLNLPAIEQEILAKWNNGQAFEQSVSLREGKTPFVFYEGPPSANGMPGIHHVISRTLKDLVCRYKTMQGFQVKRKGGWDTHGLPIELGVEKELGITKEDIGKKISVEEYNQKCREAVLRYKGKWDELTMKMGYWVDLNDPYITYDNKYIETLWWILSELYKKGYLYESVSIQPYSPAAGTGLSSHELNQPGTYKDVKDTSAVVMFKAVKDEKSKFLFDALANDELYFLAWTTTPWTLPSNLGLTVGPNIDYQIILTSNPYTNETCYVIIAKDLVGKYIDTKLAFIGGEEHLTYLESEKNHFERFEYLKKNDLLPKKGLTYGIIIGNCKGSQLEGCQYEQLLPYEANSLKAIKEITPDAQPFRVIAGDFVTTEDGTGIVHTAPAFGADDYRVGKKNNIGILTLVDRQGKFVDGLGEFSNRYVKNYKDEKDYVDVNVDISVKLKKENRAFKVEKYEHSYPHCWRTDKPILYYPLDAWFIKTTAVKERMVELNKTINWKPRSTGEGRFGNWLENMVDWNLSRSRYWGTPLPIWRLDIDPISHEENGEFTLPFSKFIGSIKELLGGYYFDIDSFRADLLNASPDIKNVIEEYNKTEKITSQKDGEYGSWFTQGGFINYNELVEYVSKQELSVDVAIKQFNLSFGVIKHYLKEITESDLPNVDLHRNYVDKVIFVDEESKMIYYRVPDLIDVWFDSGAMPYAQWHYPFENKDFIDKGQAFPADFIAEGVDQTRGWFYTLHALGVMLFDSVAYKAVVSNGLVLDKDGNKMSKRLGNVVNPFETIEKYGADATRWYLITNASPWDNLKFDLAGIQEVQRKFFGTLYNTYQFFALYANVDGFAFEQKPVPLAEKPEIDRWILSSLNTLIKNVTRSMDEYEPTLAGRAIEEFVDEHLSNWYVRLCRRRFWKGEYEQDKISAYQTLYECIETIVRLMAPISPFFSDALFRNLNSVTGKFKIASVHHADFPVANEAVIDTSLEERMQLAQDVCSLILSLRKKVNIKVRQPLQKIMIPVLDAGMKTQLEKIEDLIKAEVNVKEMVYITETEGVISKKIKANFKALGTRMGAKMKAVSAAIANFSQVDIATVEKEGKFTLYIDNEPVEIELSDVDIVAEDIPGWSVASKGSLTVALDITLTDELKQEGDAREFVNRVQNIRKESGFELTDRIFVTVLETTVLKPSLIKYNDYICREILADNIDWSPEITSGTEVEINDEMLKVVVNKKG